MNEFLSLNDRVAGSLLGLAAGDALGAPHEFDRRMNADVALFMQPTRLWGREAGEWTDDTDMAVGIALAAARHRSLSTAAALDDVANVWMEWIQVTTDAGMQTSVVLNSAERGSDALLDRAARFQELNPDAAGNGSLMRTASVAYATLASADKAAAAASVLSLMTHPHPNAVSACVLWTLAVRHTLLTGEYPDLRDFLPYVSTDQADFWRPLIAEAEQHPVAYFSKDNGWVVRAMQAAWSAITHSNQSGPHGYREAVEAAIHGGGDTDTIAAIAGGLAGARWGESAIPADWTDVLHGWPDFRADDLRVLAAAATVH